MPTRLSEPQINEQTRTLAGWERSGSELTKQLKFSDFKEAMAFVNKVAAAAEAMDHHPDILIQYSRVTLTLSTHSAGGLTDLDFELAKKISALL